MVRLKLSLSRNLISIGIVKFYLGGLDEYVSSTMFAVDNLVRQVARRNIECC